MQKKLGFNVIVYSTGYIKDITAILRSLHNISLDRIIFSLYGGNDSVHDSITKKAGSFMATVKAINMALINIGEVELHFVPMNTNFKELPSVVNLAHSLGIQKISVLRFVPQGRGVKKNFAIGREDTAILRKIISDLRDDGSNIRLGSPYSIMCFQDSPYCGAAINKMTISPSLSIAPCDAFKQITANFLGIDDNCENLSSCSLQEAWENSGYFNAVRAYLSSSAGEECEACLSFDKCHSGCVAQKVHLTGKLSKMPDPLCLRQSQLHAM